jgi:hypothetical protein
MGTWRDRGFHGPITGTPLPALPPPPVRLVPAVGPATGKVERVFVIFGENTTFDRMYGLFPNADGDPNLPTSAGKVGGLLEKLRFEPTHGSMSYFFRRVWAQPLFRYTQGPEQAPIQWNLARDYTLFDNFRAHLGASTGGHNTVEMGRSGGVVNNPKVGVGPFHWKYNPARPMQYLFGNLPLGLPIDNKLSTDSPRTDFAILQDRLLDKGISVAIYGDRDIEYFRPLTGRYAHMYRPNDQFFTDIARGTLPQVSFIFPEDAAIQDGPGYDAFVGRHVDAAVKAGMWDTSQWFGTWDDWGGYGDHRVERPKYHSFVGGGRIPAQAWGPWAAQGVYHTPTTQASFDAFLTTTFGLDAAPYYDASEIDDLTGAMDYARSTPLPPPATLDPQSAATTLPALNEWIADWKSSLPVKRSFVRRVLHLGCRYDMSALRRQAATAHGLEPLAAWHELAPAVPAPPAPGIELQT